MNFPKYKTFAIYYTLTFLLLGLIPVLAILFNQGSLDFDGAALRASENTGLKWSSNIYTVFRLILVEPILLLLVLGSAVPALAAIATLFISGEKHKWKEFLKRIIPLRGVDMGKGSKIYAEIFIILLPALLLTYFIRSISGGNYSIAEGLFGIQIFPAIFAIAFLDQGALFEELGWRGFATPELQDKGITPLKVALLIGICWGLWHLPRDITTGVIERLGNITYLFLYLPSFLLGTVSVSIIASYYFNKTGGSVLPAIIIHGITNDSIGLSGQAGIIDALTPYHQFTKAIPFALIALILVKHSAYQLNRNKKENE